jgi:hypothetical protein
MYNTFQNWLIFIHLVNLSQLYETAVIVYLFYVFGLIRLR